MHLMVGQSSSNVFQEDVYPEAPAGVASNVSAEAWAGGEQSAVVMRSMKPDGMTSVFEISVEEGGKDLAVEMTRRQAATASSASLEAAKSLAGPSGPVLLPPEVRLFAVSPTASADALTVFVLRS